MEVHKQHFGHHQQERPYHADRTTSRPLCEVKRRRARLVLRWGTTWEALVLFLFTHTIVGRGSWEGKPWCWLALFLFFLYRHFLLLDYRLRHLLSSSSLDTPSLTPFLLATHYTPSLSLCRTALLTLLGLGPTPHRHRSALRSCLGCNNKSKGWVFGCWGNNKQQSVAYTKNLPATCTCFWTAAGTDFGCGTAVRYTTPASAQQIFSLVMDIGNIFTYLSCSCTWQPILTDRGTGAV